MPKRQAKTSSNVTSKSRHYTRPGVESAARLLSLKPISNHLDKWTQASEYYSSMIEAKGGSKLAGLDRLRQELAQTWQDHSDESNNEKLALAKEQLLDVVIEWKFLKGKPRHALKPLLQSNSEASVRKHSSRAFELADEITDDFQNDQCNGKISSALNELCELKGVGPATASAILGMYRPDVFAFMDDELIECLYDGKRGYTLKIYMEVNTRCREIAQEIEKASTNSTLSKSGGKYGEWTAYKVGQVLWTIAIMDATKDNRLSELFDGHVKSSAKKVTAKSESEKTPENRKRNGGQSNKKKATKRQKK